MIDERLVVEPLENQYPSDKSHAANWLQTPPSQMPWGVPSANQPTIMRFTGDTCSPIPNPMGYTNHAFDMGQIANLKCFGPTKRKICDEFEELLPNKQLITEEKMAANLDGLHISSDYVPHQCGTVSASDLPGNSNVQQNPEENHMPTLVLCDELRRLTAETVIPQTVMAKIERPTNALVLWQPPAGNLGARLQQIVEACRGTNSSNDDNSKSSSWNCFNNNNNNSNATEDMNDPNSKKEKQNTRSSIQDDSLMEL